MLIVQNILQLSSQTQAAKHFDKLTLSYLQFLPLLLFFCFTTKFVLSSKLHFVIIFNPVGFSNAQIRFDTESQKTRQTKQRSIDGFREAGRFVMRYSHAVSSQAILNGIKTGELNLFIFKFVIYNKYYFIYKSITLIFIKKSKLICYLYCFTFTFLTMFFLLQQITMVNEMFLAN